MTERQLELKAIVKAARYNKRLAHNRLRTAQRQANDVKADDAYTYLAYYNEVIDNALNDLYYANGELK
jgi:hypothetical protein